MKRALTTLTIVLIAAAALVYCCWPGTTTRAPLESGVLVPDGRDPASPELLESPAVAEDRAALPVSKAAGSPIGNAVPIEQALGHTSIEGVVVRLVGEHEEPISDAQVSLHGYDEPFVIDSPLAVATPPLSIARTVTRADGTFAFRELSSRQYQVRAQLPSGEEKQVSTKFLQAQQITRVRLVFGSVQLHGIVRATDGAPLADIAVRLDAPVSSEAPTQDAWCFTNARGEYRFAQLASGAYELFVGSRSSHPFVRSRGELKQLEGWPSCECRLKLVEGDDVTLDIGAAEGTARWQACLRTPFGDHYGAGKLVTLDREWRTSRGSELGMTFMLTTRGVDGFSMHVPPGVWDQSVLFGERDTWHSPAALTVQTTDFEKDLVISGTRVTGMVLNDSTGAPLKSSEGPEHIRIRRFLHDDDPDPDHEATVGADGTYTLLVHGAGDWVLGAEPLRLVGGKKRLDVEIPAAEEIHHLDLKVQKP